MHIRGVEGHGQAVGPVAVLDADGAAVVDRAHVQVVVLDGPVGIQVGLHRVHAAAVVVGHVLELDDQARAVVVVVDLAAGRGIEVVPEQGQHVQWRPGRRQRAVAHLGARGGEADPAVGADPEGAVVDAVVGEGEAQIGRAPLFGVVAQGHGRAQGVDLDPVEGRTAGLVAVAPVVAEGVRPAGAVDGDDRRAQVLLPLGQWRSAKVGTAAKRPLAGRMYSGEPMLKSSTPWPTLVTVRVSVARPPVSSVADSEAGDTAMVGASRVVAEVGLDSPPRLPYSSFARTAKW